MLSRGKILLTLALFVMGCSSDSDVPEATSISYLRGLYRGYPTLLHEECYIEGEVISSDRSEEFHHRIVVQDATGGIAFAVDYDALHTLLSVGDRVRVRCGGLTLGSYSHSLRLGRESAEGIEVSDMSLAEWKERFEIVGVSERLHTTHIEIGSLSAPNLSTWVRIEGVRVVEAGEMWADEGVSLTRHLVDIDTPSDTLRVRLSGYSDFWDQKIPLGECQVEGVLDYFSDDYQLVINSPDGVLTENEK